MDGVEDDGQMGREERRRRRERREEEEKEKAALLEDLGKRSGENPRMFSSLVN